MEWKAKQLPYSNGKVLYLGKYQVTSVDWDACTSDKSLRYKVTIRLPGIKEYLGNFATEEEGKQFAEKVVNRWIESAGLKFQ